MSVQNSLVLSILELNNLLTESFEKDKTGFGARTGIFDVKSYSIIMNKVNDIEYYYGKFKSENSTIWTEPHIFTGIKDVTKTMLGQMVPENKITLDNIDPLGFIKSCSDLLNLTEYLLELLGSKS